MYAVSSKGCIEFFRLGTIDISTVQLSAHMCVCYWNLSLQCGPSEGRAASTEGYWHGRPTAACLHACSHTYSRNGLSGGDSAGECFWDNHLKIKLSALWLSLCVKSESESDMWNTLWGLLVRQNQIICFRIWVIWQFIYFSCGSTLRPVETSKG